MPFFYRAVYEIMWKNVEPGRPQMTIWRMRVACWIPKATSTQSEYGIHISFTLQQWLHERASLLGYTYIACLVLTSITSCEGKCNQSVDQSNSLTYLTTVDDLKPSPSNRVCIYSFVYLSLNPFQ